jgi:putative tricarboxylic transport membrane protein
MKSRRKAIALSTALVLTVPLAAWDASRSEGVGGPTTSLTILVPGSAGGGYDSLARETQKVLRDNRLSGNVQVVNVPGASGTVGLKSLVEMDDRDNAVLVLGSAMVGGIEVTKSTTTFDDVTPITSATTDYPVFVLPEGSPYANAQEFLEGWAADPEGHPIGGGALGNTDHLAVLALARAAGIDPGDVNYIAYSGGGEVLGAMLSGTVAAGVSGYGEVADQIASGRVAGLGVAAPEPIDGIDMPTFVEQGVDLVMPNWRGFVAPPNISDDSKKLLEGMFEDVFATPAWQDALERQQWNELALQGDEFTDFIDGEVQNTRELLEEVE